MNTLHLTMAERVHFDALPERITKDWAPRVQQEELTAYESAEVIKVRMEMLPLDEYPEMQNVVNGYIEQAEADEPLSDMSFLREFPQELLPEFLFAVGAVGITALVEASLQEQPDDKAMEYLALLTEFRHRILEANAKYAS